MDPEIREAIAAIHAGRQGVVMVCTGGGTTALAWLLAVPGASATVLEALVPYSRPAQAGLLGAAPEHSTSPEAARAMAERAYARARRYSREAGALPPEAPVLGLGCTAALATNYAKRGEHRALVAVRAADSLTLYTLVLAKGARDRAGEEEVVSRLVMRALAEACGVAARIEPGLLPGEEVTVQREERPSPVARLLRGELQRLLVLTDGQMVPDQCPEAILLPGAFNPLHAGHRQLAATAAAMLRRPVVFELSVENVDKPSLSEEEVYRRLRQFLWLAPVVLTRAPTFRRKAALFPAPTFVIGCDTLQRLFAPRYYGGEPEMQAALAEIRASGARFLVAGRRSADGFRTLAHVPIPAELRPMFTAVPEERFRSDLSSTALRAAQEAEKESTWRHGDTE